MNVDLFYDCAAVVWWRWRRRWHPFLDQEDAIQDAVLACVRRAPTYDADRASERTFYSLVCYSSMNEELKRATRLKKGGRALTRSLQAEIKGYSDRHDLPRMLLSFLASDQPQPDELAEQEDERRAVRRAVSRLPERLRRLAEGIMEGRTLREDGERFGVTAERVRQLRLRAVDKLRVLVSS